MKNGFLYPRSIVNFDQHWYHIINYIFYLNNIDNPKDKYFLANNLQHDLQMLKSEIIKSKCNNIIFSTEGILWEFSTIKHIYSLKKFLKGLGCSNIKIIIYLKNIEDLLISMISQDAKADHTYDFNIIDPSQYERKIFNYQWILETYSYFFGKKNLIVKLFDKEIFGNNLLKDFANSINIPWNDDFIIPKYCNNKLNLMGFEIQKRINTIFPGTFNPIREEISCIIEKNFTKNVDELKIRPKKEILNSYVNYFEYSNEWVRKEFFPHKERLFPKKDMSTYKENYELRKMKPEYWDKIAEFIADIIKTKNENILSLNQTLKIKNQLLIIKENLLNFQNRYGKAKTRIQNQLSYKLGRALILNSKSVLGFIFLPFIILSIVISHKQEQKAYKLKIKKNPKLVLPPLETYPDYNEALKEKECFTYKLGEEFIKASKNWYGGGGYIKFYFKDVPRLKRKIKEK
ncbi:hypothetical protein ACMU5J_000109 [Campylobacter jejuni]